MRVASTEPSARKVPLASTSAPTATAPSSWSIPVAVVTCTMRLPTVQSPIKPVVLGKFIIRPTNSNSFSETEFDCAPVLGFIELPTKHKIAMVTKNILRWLIDSPPSKSLKYPEVRMKRKVLKQH